MHNDEYKPDQEEQEEDPIISIIQDIKDGVLNPKALSYDEKKRCVRFLIKRQGYEEEQVAQILKRSERSVRRYLKDVNEEDALPPSSDLATKIIGNMFHSGMVHHRYLMRLARSPEATQGEKAQSEFMAWRVLKEMVEKMQSLGYLPLKPQAVVSDIYHHEGGDTKTYMELKEELKNIERIAKEAGTLDKETEDSIKLLEKRIEKAEITEEIVDLQKNKTNEDKKLQEGEKNEPEQHT